MTEAEWLAAANPPKMLEALRDKQLGRGASARKRRLFVAACCRRVEHLLPEDSRRAVDTGERFADGAAMDEERVAARERADHIVHMSLVERHGLDNDAANCALWAVEDQAHFKRPRTWSRDTAYQAAGNLLEMALRVSPEAFADEQAALVRLTHCIFGNPFRTVSFDPVWLTSTVTALAAQMYDSRDFSLMPILGDALQDAGCDHAAVLAHCRGPGPHVRGCWVIDRVLGKE